MELLQDGLIAMLSVIGLTALLWLLAEAILHPRHRRFCAGIGVIPVRESAEGLEGTVRALTRLRYEEGGFSEIWIVDCGMDEAAREVSALLCRENYHVMLCTPEDVVQKIKSGG